MHPERPLPPAVLPPPGFSRRARLATFVAVLAGSPFLFVAVALLGRFVVHGPVNAGSLSYSVASATGAGVDLFGAGASCRRTA